MRRPCESCKGKGYRLVHWETNPSDGERICRSCDGTGNERDDYEAYRADRADRVGRTFTLTITDWHALMDASASARHTPVILVAGVDASAAAHKRVLALWDEMGKKYGFIPDTVQPGNEDRMEIRAEPVPPSTPAVALDHAIEQHDRSAS